MDFRSLDVCSLSDTPEILITLPSGMPFRGNMIRPMKKITALIANLILMLGAPVEGETL